MDDNIIEFIYKSCDPANTNCVQVSSLIDVIKPYMPNNLKELADLQSKLDPHNKDPHIDYAFFQKIMSDWIANMQEDDINNSLSEFPVHFNQSFNHNMSQISFNSTSNNNNKINEGNATAEEQVADLKLKLNKAMSELELVKQQLAACEDQNESLLADLKCQKMQHKERICERVCQSSQQSEDIVDEVNEASKKCEQLEKMLSNSDKQQQEYLARLNKLETENLNLKSKVHLLEKFKGKDRKSLCELRDSLDEKESEVTTLMEIIDDLKSQLEEKVDLLNFYTKEHKLLKQKTHELETLIKNNICRSHTAISQEISQGGNSQHIFNTPKLLKQLANPITPFIKDFSTSSPLKDSPLSGTADSNDCDFLCNSNNTVATMKTSPKTLKDELAEVSYIRLNESDDELGRLQKLVRHQEHIKNDLWENMKQLSNYNEELLDYRKEYLDLLLSIQDKDKQLENMKKQNEEKDQALIDIKKEMELLNQKQREIVELPKHGVNEDAIRQLTCKMTSLEDNLIKQKSISTDMKTGLMYASNAVKKAVLEHLSKEAKSTQTDDTHIEKSMLNQSIQVDEGFNSWNLKPSLEQPDLRKSNYAKQQMRIERLVEKHEKIAKDLDNERAINTKLTLMYQAKCADNENIKKDVESHHKEMLKQTQLVEVLLAEKDLLQKGVDILKLENANLISEMDHLRAEITILKSENLDLNENLRVVVNKLTAETTVSNQLRLENELLLNNQCHLETKLRDDRVRQFHLKKYLIDSDNVHKMSLSQLQSELLETGTELRTLRKQNEVASVDVFISSCCEELRRELLSVRDIFKLDYDFSNTEMRLEDSLDLESEMIALKKLVSLATSFMQYVRNAHLSTVNEIHEISSSSVGFNHHSDEDESDEAFKKNESFASCSSDISDFAREEVESLSFECDSCFEDFQLESFDLRNLSRKEREEKFATLALLLTVDVTTLKKRICSEQEKFNQMATTFFSHLNYILHLLCNHKRNVNQVVVTHLNLMKTISKNIFKTAVQCGMLHSEQRTANCWRLAINYVALLNQENKKLIEKNSNSPKLEMKHFPVISFQEEQKVVATPCASRSSQNSTFKFWICVFVTFIFLVSLLFYVDHQCPRNTKRVCPLQWISQLFVEKIPSESFRL